MVVAPQKLTPPHATLKCEVDRESGAFTLLSFDATQPEVYRGGGAQFAQAFGAYGVAGGCGERTGIGNRGRDRSDHTSTSEKLRESRAPVRY